VLIASSILSSVNEGKADYGKVDRSSTYSSGHYWRRDCGRSMLHEPPLVLGAFDQVFDNHI